MKKVLKRIGWVLFGLVIFVVAKTAVYMFVTVPHQEHKAEKRNVLQGRTAFAQVLQPGSHLRNSYREKLLDYDYTPEHTDFLLDCIFNDVEKQVAATSDEVMGKIDSSEETQQLSSKLFTAAAETCINQLIASIQ